MVSQPVVELRGITKRFLDVAANSAIDFTLYPGEICALLGENGAGKTTLMNILFGYYTCDEGAIRINGQPVHLASPKDAIRHGIKMVHQHFTLVPSHTVLENIIIGAEPGKGLLLNMKAARRKVRDLQQRYGLTVDPDAKVWTLSIGEQQKVEILKALYRDAQVLIMDEPTAVLVPAEVTELFAMLRAYARAGNSVVFISHKLNEVMAISDRIVVLRNGQVSAERRASDTTAKELATLMVGREVLERIERRPTSPGKPVLTVQNLAARNDKGLLALKGLNLTVRAKEVVGIAGVSGNGQRELAEVLFGIRMPEHGDVRIGAARLKPGQPKAAIAAGMGRIPEDRMSTGLCMDLSIEENLMLETHSSPQFQRFGLRKFEAAHRASDELMRAYNIKAANRDTLTKSLSGGNVQKVILARELAGEPTVILAAQPTRGLDVGAMEYIHQRILVEKERGAGVLLISEDLDEIFNLSDRIVVLYEGEILGEVMADQADRSRIGLWMSGVRA